MSQHAQTQTHATGLQSVVPAGAPGSGRVLVGVDGSPANQAALDWAVHEAHTHNRPLLLVAVGSGATSSTSPSTSPRVPDLESEHRRHLTENLLDDISSRVSSQVDDVSSRAEVGEPSHGLLRAVSDGDLLVVGKRGAGALARVVIGSTAIAVAGRSEVPVVVVPEAWSSTGHPSGPVIVGFDDTDRDAAVLDFAFHRALENGAPIVVVCAWQVPAVYSWSSEDRKRWSLAAGAQLHEALLPWTLRYPTLDTTVETGTGWHETDAADSLLGAASRAQLLVLGRHTGAHHLGGFDFGSTSRKVLHHARVPVAIVPTASVVPEEEGFDEGDSPEF